MPQAAFDILGLGTAFIDDFVHVDSYPVPDHKAEITGENRRFGGIVATGLAAASRLGAKCAYAGYFGPDELSASMLAGFADVGVDCSKVLPNPKATPGHSLIVVDDTTHTRNIFYNLQGVMPLRPQDITEELIASARVLFFDHVGVPTNIAAATIAHRLGVPVVADVEWADAMRGSGLLELIDHLMVSTQFARAYTGLDDWAKAAVTIPGSGERACTGITCGAEGCYYLLAGSRIVRHCPAYKVDTVETTGCGDVFHGAYAAALASGQDTMRSGQNVLACIEAASAAAAVYASRPSGWEHLATRADVAKLQKSQTQR